MEKDFDTDNAGDHKGFKKSVCLDQAKNLNTRHFSQENFEKTMFRSFWKVTWCEDCKIVWKSERNTNSYWINRFQSSFDLIFLRNEERSILCTSVSAYPCIKKMEERSGARWVRYVSVMRWYNLILRKREICCHTKARQGQIRILFLNDIRRIKCQSSVI